MTDMMDDIDEERESLYELISVGAIRAAHALSTILGHEIAAGSPSVKQIDQGWADGNWGTGVIFEVDGEISGLVAILLPTVSRKVLGALMVGKDSPRDQEAATRSALRELGNIVASHTVTGVADRLGSRIMLSVPTLVMENADVAFLDQLAETGTTSCLESEFSDSEGEIHARLLFAAESKPESPSR
jgi:chemotaxis protein CheY-P-specific phosphatase CheC